MKFLPFILLVVLLEPYVKGQDFNQTQIPDWVKPVDIPKESKFSKYDISSGYYSVLEDYQVNLTDFEVFNRSVTSVLSYTGISDASQLSITYDTSYQVLNIHHLYIWRNGKKTDRTHELSFEIMHNEFNLDQGIYSGKITAYDILEDIRKGDLIEFAYTLVGDNPIFEKEKYLLFPLESLSHIDVLSYRVIYPRERNYSYRFSDPDSVQYTDTIINNMHEIGITLANNTPVQLENNIPSWVIPYDYFSISSTNSWEDVNLWAQDVFRLKSEPNLEMVFDEIFKGEESTDEKIDKIINFVQDDIRYMGIESGIGSIKPFPPEQVVSQRFGDCKDKSLLLVWLLKQIGVEKASPVLANTSMLNKLDQLLPSNQVFNHCIVKFEYKDSVYWLDPTITLQGGNYKTLCTPNYGKVLVVGETLDSLQTMTTKVKGSANIEERIVIPSLSEPATLKIISKRDGFSADSRRSILEYYPLENLSKYVEDELKLVFPVVEQVGDIEVHDNIDSNQFSVIYNYTIDDFLTDSRDSYNVNGYSIFRHEPQTLYSRFNESTCTERENSYFLDDSEDLNYTVTIEFPKEMLIYDAYNVHDHKAYVFEEQIEQLNPKTVKLEYRYKNKVKFIRAKEYKDFCEERKKIIENLPTVFYFPN